MSWNRSLQPWAWTGPENIELPDRPISSSPPVLILAVPHGFNSSVWRGRGGIPFGWKRMEDMHGQAWNEMNADADGIDEKECVGGSVQRVDQPRVTQSLVPRHVQGPVLSDQEGRLYEKCNDQVRLLGRIIRGAHGRLFELVPRDEHARARHEADEERREEIDQDARNTSHAKKASKGYVSLFPGKDIKRVARFGEVKGLLLSQVMEPNRLRDEHRLLCRIEMFELTLRQSMESFASALLSETGIAGQLQLLTEVMLHKLQLAEMFPRRSPTSQVETRQPGMLLPGDRVFRLILVSDPTSDQRPVHSGKPKMTIGSEEAEDRPKRRSEPSSHGDSLKTVIPECFTKPWEFQLSREEALYDMRMQIGNSSIFDRFRGWKRNGDELKKWQVLLVGKELDEQLWGVRPPTHAFHHAEIREWVQRTLQQAGYDAGVMLPEWEVYWRRKGV